MAYSNTGIVTGDKSRGVFNRLFIFNGSISAADAVDGTTHLAKLVTNSKLSATNPQKVFPVPEAQDLARASEANKEGSLNKGFKAILAQGKKSYKVKLFAGSALLKSLRSFNNATIRVVEYDDNGNFAYTQFGNTLIGFKAKVFFDGGEIATGQNVEEDVVEATISILSNSEYIDNVKFLSIGSGNVENIAGLNDAVPTFVSKASNVHKVKYEIKSGEFGKDINIGDSWSTQLANASQWTAYTGTGFTTSLAITSVTWDSVTKAFVFTFDSTAYTGLSAGAAIKLSAVEPEVLDAANVTGIEILPIVLTK